MMRLHHAAWLLSLAGASAAAGTDPALVPNPLILEGQSVPGVGLVTSVSNLAVNNSATVIVECDTDNSNTDIDLVLLDAAGGLLFQEGQALAAPAGALLDTFDAVTINNNGNSGWNFFLDNTTGTNDDSGIYYDGTLLLQEGALSSAIGFSGPTPYVGFFETKINDLDQILVMASVDDPGIASTVDRALVILNAPGGGLAGETIVLKEGDAAPGILPVETITDMDTGPHNFDFNNAGDVLVLCDITGDSAKNAVIYRNTEIIAREGDPSPIPGRLWSSLTSPELSINNSGDYVFSGSLDGDSASNVVIVQGDEVLAQEGSTLPDIAPFTFTSFGSGPILISDDGDVLWYGDWNDTDTTKDTGLFLNHKLIVQEGDTIGGQTVTALRGIQDGYTMSDDGRYILFEAQLGTSTDAAVLIDRGPWQNLGGALAGTAGVTPRLRGSGSLVGGDLVTLCVDRGAPSATSFLVLGLSQVNIPFLATTLVPSPNLVITGLPLDGDGGLQLSAPWPAGVPSGVSFYFQWFVNDAAAPQGWSSTNAVVGTTP